MGKYGIIQSSHLLSSWVNMVLFKVLIYYHHLSIVRTSSQNPIFLTRMKEQWTGDLKRNRVFVPGYSTIQGPHDSRLVQGEKWIAIGYQNNLTERSKRMTMKSKQNLKWVLSTVPLETMGPFARRKTLSLPNVVAANSPRWDENRNLGNDKATESCGELDAAMSR